MKRFLVVMSVVLTAAIVNAQLPTDFRTEQIYLNPDRHAYLQGDSIGLEGVVTCIAQERTLPYSNYLTVELIDESDSVLVRQKLTCRDKGYFNTVIPTQYEWHSGVYYLRAYTELMRNFSPECFPIQPFLFGKTFPTHEGTPLRAHVEAIPSGGQLVTGHPQALTVHLRDEVNFPLQTDVYLVNERGDTLTNVSTSASGIAQLRFIPEPSQSYFVIGQVGGITFRKDVPEACHTVKLQGSINNSGRRLSYQVLNAETTTDVYTLYTFDRLNGIIELDEVKKSGIIMLENAPKVITMFLTDKDLNIISECTVSPRHSTPYKLTAADTLHFDDELSYNIEPMPDSCIVMARVVPENDLLTGSIERSLLYTSDYSSPIPFPSLTKRDSNAEHGTDLQAWLNTATFQRFNLKEAIDKGDSIYKYQPEQAMQFSGWIEQSNKHPQHGGTLIAYHSSKNLVYDTDIDEEGRFRIAVDDFAEGEEFYLQAINTKGKAEFVRYHLDDETFPAVVNHSRYRLPHSRYAETETTVGGESKIDYTVGRDSLRNYILPNISVKARLHEEEPPKDTPQFYNTNYIDREEIEAWDFQTVWDILQYMPGVIATKDDNYSNNKDAGKGNGSTYKITSVRGASSLRATGFAGADNNLVVLIDGSRYTPQQFEYVLHMNASEIESIELLRPWQTNAYVAGAVNGALLIKTRRYKEHPNLASKGARYSPTGLSPLQNGYRGKVSTPIQKGSYRLIVDVLSESCLESYEHRFVVE